MEPKKILEAIRNIEEALEKYTFDTANEEAKQKIFCLAANIQFETADEHIQERVTEIKEWTEILCSGRKHPQYGILQVKGFILSACDGIKAQLRAYRLMR